MDDLDLPLPDLPLPDLELDLPASAAAKGACEVHVGPVRDPVDSAPAIAELLGVDLGAASMICVNAPGVILRDAPRVEAERVATGLRRLGLRAEVVDPSDRRMPERLPPPPGASRTDRPYSSAPPPSAGAAAMAVSASQRPPYPSSRPDPLDDAPPPGGFWGQLPIAFVAPVLGKGLLLLAAAGVLGVATALSTLLPGISALAILIVFQLAAVGVFVTTFDRLAQSGLTREEDQTLPDVDAALPGFSELALRGLGMTVLLVLLGALPVIVAFWTESLALTIAAQITMFVYWPMALTLHSVSGTVLGALDVVRIGRAMIVAPLEYVVVCVLTFAAMSLVTVVMGLAAGVGGLALGAAEGQLGVSLGVMTALFFTWYLCIGYFHGVLGYLMGTLVRSKGERFEFLAE